MTATGDTELKPRTTTRRLGIFDVARGCALVMMILFHLTYDLVYIKGVSVPWFSGDLVVVWRRIISWTFIFVAGCMACLSRDNLKRAGVYGLVAVIIYLVTYVAGVDTPISFGVIYCMAACTFVYWLLTKLGLTPRGCLIAALFFIVFLALLHLSGGTIGFGAFNVTVPRAPYESGLLSWAGFPGPGFASGDYYPLLPYLFLYLTGASLAARWGEAGYPDWAYDCRIQPLNWLGQHSLLIYALHQPIILAALSLIQTS